MFLDKAPPSWYYDTMDAFRPDSAEYNSETNQTIRKSTMHMMESLERSYKAGDTMKLFKVVQIFADTGTPLPPWAARAFHVHLVAYVSGAVGTLDEAFGAPQKNMSRPNIIMGGMGA
jgi:hypothetical protein